MSRGTGTGRGGPDGRVSVIIPVFDGAAVLPAQLRALASQTYGGSFEVIVADNGSADATAAVARELGRLFTAFRLVEASQVRGPSHARNAGARHARGELLLFCDADDVVGPRWVESMVAAASHSDAFAGVGVETSDPETHVWTDAPLEPVTRFRFLPWHRSSNLGFRREAFETIGGFDETRRVGEDVDICWRVQLAGYRFSFVSEAQVAYRERGSLAAAVARQFRFGRAAPGLYRDFAGSGAPPPGFTWVLGSTVLQLLRAPRALTGRESARRWIVAAGGLAGRWVGVINDRVGRTTR